MMASVGLGTFI